MDGSPWAPVAHSDRYHGQVDTRDRHSLWVLRHLHLVSGWCVEIRIGAPDGQLLDRRWVATSWEGSEIVDERRSQLARQDLAEVLDCPWTIEAAPAGLGVIVTHGHHGRYPQRVSVDGGPDRSVCGAMWVPAGRHTITWSWVQQREVGLVSGSVVHTHPKWAGLLRRPDGQMLPPWHRCRARSLRFEGGLLRADGDVWEAALGGFPHIP